MTEKPNLENLLNAIIDSTPEKDKRLVESYLRNPETLSKPDKNQAEKILIKQYPSLFKKTKKRSLKQKIFIGLACLALGLGLGIGGKAIYYTKPEKYVVFDQNAKTITCYPEEISFRAISFTEIRILEDFYNYQISKKKLDHDRFVRDLYELDMYDGVDSYMPSEKIKEYVEKELNSN